MDIKEKEALLCSKYNNINRLLAMNDIGRQDREDLLHDIFINALRSLDKLRDVNKMDSWLWKITRNEVNRYWRRSMKTRGTVRSIDAEDFEGQEIHINDEHYNMLTNEIDNLGTKQELIYALNKLNKKTLMVFRLYYFEGYRLNEISQITGESSNTVKSRHYRGLIKLKKILENLREKEEQEKDESEKDELLLEIQGDLWYHK